MKKLPLLFLFLMIATLTYAQKSPRTQTTGDISGVVTVDVDWSAPSVRNRVIWGDLVPYGKVWRAGADKNTTISFSKDVKINGQTLPAGKYGLFIIPNKDSDWVLVLNKKNDAWGAYSYSESEDALRVNIKPEIANESVEALKFSVNENVLFFEWEKIRLLLPISN